jgi:hypothetical protein
LDVGLDGWYDNHQAVFSFGKSSSNSGGSGGGGGGGSSGGADGNPGGSGGAAVAGFPRGKKPKKLTPHQLSINALVVNDKELAQVT